MAITLATNVASLSAQRHLSKPQHHLNKNLGRLSSGLRINSAADDAAGLAISEALKSQIRSLKQAERNAMDGVSLLQTSESAMNEISAILTRMRELSIQSANGTLGSTERGFLNTELNALTDEINRIAEVTEFNGLNVLNGSHASAVNALDFQVGIQAASTNQISVIIDDMHASQLGLNAASSGGVAAAASLDAIDITTVSGALAALNTIDQAISDVSSNRADLGAAQNRLEVTISNLQSANENLSAANSRIRDVDIADETASMARHNILMQSGVSVLAQANQLPSIALSLLQ